jgi:hypothetical protein
MKRAFCSLAAITLISAMAGPTMAQSGNGITHGGYPGSGLPNAGQVERFDNGYLDEHPQVAGQLSRDPRLVDNQQFLANHPGLVSYLSHHPELRTELEQHPDRFMNDEHYWERFENSVSFQQVARGLPNAGQVERFDNGYLDEHPQVAGQLSRDPRLVDNPQFLANHPGLESYLGHHPELRTELEQHPDRFMNDEHYYERFENSVSSQQVARRLPNAGQVAGFDNGYLDEHPEVAGQLSRDPRLVDNPQFLAGHPGLDSYLAHHPKVRTDLQRNPVAFMNDERQYEHHEKTEHARDHWTRHKAKQMQQPNNHRVGA